MSLNRCDKTLLGQIECYLTPITKQLFSLEGEHYVTLSTAIPKVSYLLNKALDPVPSDAVCTSVAKMVFKDYVQHRYVKLYMDTDNLDALNHGLLSRAHI
jgi:hypothetical protein